MQVSSDRRVPARRIEFASAIVLAALASVATPPPAYAQWAVTCVNCSTTWTQLLQYAKEAQALETQLQQYQTQLQQYTNMITNTVALPQEIWGTVQSDIMQVQALSNAASLLSGNSGSMITQLQSASAYANQVTSLGNTAGQFTTWQQTIGNNLNTMGQTLGLQKSQQQNEAAILQALQQHSQSAQGQMQAIQAGNELAGANAAQLAQIQATLVSTAQMQATGMAVQADRQATEDAAMAHFATQHPVATQATSNIEGAPSCLPQGVSCSCRPWRRYRNNRRPHLRRGEDEFAGVSGMPHRSHRNSCSNEIWAPARRPSAVEPKGRRTDEGGIRPRSRRGSDCCRA